MTDQVIVLNADYTYMNTVPVTDAFRYIELGKVTVEKYTDKVINGVIRIPLIVRFIKMIRQIFKRRVKWSKPNVITRDKGICQYCGIDQKRLVELHAIGERSGKRMTVDHIRPKADGGPNTWENTCCACPDCNHKKGDKSCREINMFPKTKAFQPTIMEFILIKSARGSIADILRDFWENI